MKCNNYVHGDGIGSCLKKDISAYIANNINVRLNNLFTMVLASKIGWFEQQQQKVGIMLKKKKTVVQGISRITWSSNIWLGFFIELFYDFEKKSPDVMFFF